MYNVLNEGKMINFRQNYSDKELINILKDGEQYLSNGGVFTDGYRSNFSLAIEDFFKKNPNYASMFVEKEIRLKRYSSELFHEALCWIGKIDDALSVYPRLQLLTLCLSSDDSRIRDGGLLGIAAIDIPANYVINRLQEAIDIETIAPLKTDMQQVLDQLLKTRLSFDNNEPKDFNQIIGYETFGKDPYVAMVRIYYTNNLNGHRLNRCFPDTWSAFVEFQNFDIANYELHNFESKEQLIHVARNYYSDKVNLLKRMENEIRLEIVKQAQLLLDKVLIEGSK